MNAYPTFALLLSSLLAFGACGTSTLGGGGTGADTGTGTDTGTDTGTGTTGDGLCDGKISPVSCSPTSCPDGTECVKDTALNSCHPSSCSCTDEGWLCTADCGLNGSSCVPAAAGTCGGKPSPVSCTATSCPEGFSCVPDPDPTNCHSSACDCIDQAWSCSHDCQQNGSTCVKGL